MCSVLYSVTLLCPSRVVLSFFLDDYVEPDVAGFVDYEWIIDPEWIIDLQWTL